MFRASDIFGRRPGAVAETPAAAQKRNLSSSYVPTAGGSATRTWDPATGQYYDEDMPPEVLEMMGMKKKAKVLSAPDEASAWGSHTRTSGGVLTAGSSVKKEAPHKPNIASPVSKVDTTAPSIEYQGFSKVDLNDRYYEKSSLLLHGKPTYWNEDTTYFVYWQGEVKRWAICDGSSYTAVKAGQYPGWAYKEDHKSMSLAGGWLEAFGGSWQQPDLEVISRSFSQNKPQWEDPQVQKSITTVEFRGFAMQELNTRYRFKPGETIQGNPSYWDDSGIYFIYWQRDMGRWAICDLKCYDAVKSGQCPGWAYRSDAGHFANACGWMEQRQGDWAHAILETGVVATCTKGLKVELVGFFKEELNTQYTEKESEEIQGKATFWDANDAFFIYWQSSYSRWAICDSVSLGAAQKGLSPGWAFRTDSKHFARASGWMESYGRDWQPTSVTCTVLEGNVREDWASVKAEIKEEAEPTTNFSSGQSIELLEKVYQEKNPSKLDDLPGLLAKFAGKEKVLYEMVCKKYSVSPAAFAKKQGIVAAAGTDADEAAGDDDEYAQYENEELPNISAKQFAIRVQNVYVQYNPKKLEDLPRLLAKFRSRERQLYIEVCKKYDVNPTKFHYKCLKEGLDD
jgi:hypothetical protein